MADGNDADTGGGTMGAREGGEPADVMSGSLAGGTGTGGIGSMDGMSIGAGALGPTESGDTGTGTPPEGSPLGTGNAGVIPPTLHEGESPA